MGVPGCARRQHQDWFNDNDAVINNLLAEKNGLNRVYLERPTDANKAAFYQCRRLAQQRLRGMQADWMAHKVEEIQGYADRNESKNAFATIKTIYGSQPKELHRFSAPMDRRF
ncbi:hypothetical protein SprV_0200716500 [Sparganum proliferum]